MRANIIIHPSTLAATHAMIQMWKELPETAQLVLCTLLQVREQARRDVPLPESLHGMVRILGTLQHQVPRAELRKAESEIYATLQIMAARERGEDAPQEVGVWFREIS